MRDTDIIDAIWATAPVVARGSSLGGRTTANIKEFERHRTALIAFVEPLSFHMTVREARETISHGAIRMFLEAIDESMSMGELLEALSDES